MSDTIRASNMRRALEEMATSGVRRATMALQADNEYLERRAAAWWEYLERRRDARRASGEDQKKLATEALRIAEKWDF